MGAHARHREDEHHEVGRSQDRILVAAEQVAVLPQPIQQVVGAQKGSVRRKPTPSTRAGARNEATATRSVQVLRWCAHTY
jgi:hypothetical protein